MIKFFSCIILLVFSSLLSAETRLYGVAHIGLTDDKGKGLKLEDRTSYLGLRGRTPLENGLSVTYKFEIGYKLSDHLLNNSLYTRYSFAGLKGSFGEFRLGRQDSAYNIVDNSMIDLLTHHENGLVSESDSVNLFAFIRKFGSVGFYGSYIPASEGEKANSSFMINYTSGSIYTGIGLYKETGGKEKGLKLVVTYKKDNFGVGYIHEKCSSSQNVTAFQIEKGECTGNGKGHINHLSGVYRFGKPYIAMQIARNSSRNIEKQTLELGTVLGRGTKAYVEYDKVGSNKSTSLGLKTLF